MLEWVCTMLSDGGTAGCSSATCMLCCHDAEPRKRSDRYMESTRGGTDRKQDGKLERHTMYRGNNVSTVSRFQQDQSGNRIVESSSRNSKANTSYKHRYCRHNYKRNPDQYSCETGDVSMHKECSVVPQRRTRCVVGSLCYLFDWHIKSHIIV